MFIFTGMIHAFSILKDLSRGEQVSQTGWTSRIATWPGENGSAIPCKFFVPKNKTKSCLIVFPGASPFGENHPALNVLGAALARHGIEVIVPRIPLLMDLKIVPEIIPSMCRFYSWFTEQRQNLPIRIAGVSYGGAMVLKCLLEKPFIDRPPKAVLVYGTHCDLRRALDHYFLPEPRELTSEWPLIVFFHNFLHRIDTGYNTDGLENFLIRRVRDDEALDYLTTLEGPEGDLARSLAQGEITDEIRRLTPMILDSCNAELEFFSPSNWADGIDNRIHVLHGSQDVMVHWTQSVELSQILPHNRLLITHLFEHREMVRTGTGLRRLKELFRLILFVNCFLWKK